MSIKFSSGGRRIDVDVDVNLDAGCTVWAYSNPDLASQSQWSKDKGLTARCRRVPLNECIASAMAVPAL